jgi:hypothetical protein
VSQRKAFLLRLPPELHAALEKWAADELRSVNGQIVYLLAQAISKSGRARAARTARPEGDGEDTTSPGG